MTTDKLNELLNTYHIPQISIDFYKNNYICVSSKQLDSARYLIITLTENEKTRKIKENERAFFRAGKPDNTYVYNEEECIILEDGRLLLKLTEQTLAAKGRIEADIQLITADKNIYSTKKFYIEAASLPYDESAVESSNEFNALNKLVSEESGRVETLKELEKTVTTNETLRQANESIRETNEENRVTAEAERETDTTAAVANANTATANAAQAASNAVSATADAAQAAANANQSTQTANTVIEEMRSLITDDNILHTNTLGVPNGIATLDEEGFLSRAQIPDRTIEIIYGELLDNRTFLNTDGMEVAGGINKQYIDTKKGIPYIWSGSEFLATGSKLGLGTTSSSAFPGDRGLALENRAAALESFHNNLTADKVKYNNTGTDLLSANLQEAITELTAPATTTRPGRLSAEDKARIDNYANIREIAITLSAARWMGESAPYTQTVSLENISVYNNCCVSLNPNATPLQEAQIISANITDIQYEEASGMIFTASGDKPAVDIPIILNAGTSMNCVELPKYLGTYGSAKEISYDNTESSLRGQTVQDTVTELQTSINTHSGNHSIHTTPEEKTVWNNKAPENHASSAVTYGGGTAVNFGHVKLSDVYTSSQGGAANSIGASQTALYNAYATLNSGKAPINHTHDDRYYTETEINNLLSTKATVNHAWSNLTYGGGTSVNFGHVKLSDVYSSNVGAAANSIGASQAALFNAYTVLNNEKASTSHTHDNWYYTEAEVNNLLSKKNNNLTFISYEAPMKSVAANGTATFEVYVAKTGYKTLAISLYDTGSYNCYCYNCVISGSNAVIKLKNIATSSSVNASPKFTVMYQSL